MQKAIITYSSGDVPPPFSNSYELKLDFTSAVGVNVDFQVEYHYRDELTEEEILMEGFTGDDDFSWKGMLPEIWKKLAVQLLEAIKWGGKESADGEHMLVEIATAKGVEKKVPASIDLAQENVQQIVQAIYEAGGKEMPLELEFCIVNKGAKTLKKIQLSFASRQALILDDKGKQLASHSWDKAFRRLGVYYQIEHDYNLATEKVPGKNGSYINGGDGAWFDVKVLMEQPADRKAIEGLINLFE